MSTDLNKIAQDIEAILLQEQSQPIKSRSDIGASQLRRKEMHNLLDQIDQERARLSSQIYNLPELPNEASMNWAEWVLSLPNLAILVLDTTSLEMNADIIRVYAANQQGCFLDTVINPQRERTGNTLHTGLDLDTLEKCPKIEDAWSHIRYALRGKFIVSFTLEFVEARLKENISHYGLDRLPLRGDCLMKQSLYYFSIQRYGVKLADACMHIGHTLPTPALAQHRAEAQLTLLKAMANGVTSAPPKIDENTDLSNLGKIDDHPF